MVTKEEREGEEGQIRGMGLIDTHYHIFKIDNQQEPTV